MEQHAVPQDITGFKFKLVGEMTLKQFSELAGGAVIAYLFYATNWPFFIKWPLVAFFGLLGFALAFLPIEERSLDIWIANFIRAIYQPTLYVWKKNDVKPAFITPTTPQVVSAWPYVQPQPQPQPQPKPEPPPKPPPIESGPPPEPKPEPKQEPATRQPVSIDDLQKMRDDRIADLEGVTQRLQREAAEAKAKMEALTKQPDYPTIDQLARRRDDKRQADQMQLYGLFEQDKNLTDQITAVQTKIQALTGSDATQFQTQLTNLEKQRQDLATQIQTLQDNLVGKKESTTPAQVRVIDKPIDHPVNITLTDVPNIVNGLITDERNAPVDSVILTIKNQSGDALRALKSNQVGQFIASTPLENGTYYLEFERSGFTFDTLEIKLEGKLISPLQVKAKTNGNS